MKAIAHDVYGDADVLELREVEKPVPGDDGLLVRIHAAGVDPGVWHLMAGQPYLVRIGFGIRGPKVRIRGRDFSGEVAAVGRDVTGFRVGDEVYGTCEGSFAEYGLARPDQVSRKPVNLTHTEAAAVPVSAFTALQALRDRGRVRAGQRVLVIGAGGGVGTFAVQIAVSLGAVVTGVCGPDKTELVRGLGAGTVIDRTSQDVRGTYDLILDIAGNRPLSWLRRRLTPDGTVVLVGGEGGSRWLGVLERVLWASLLSPFTRHRLLPLISSENAADLEVLTAMIENGGLKPVVDRVYPLSGAADAVRLVHAGHTRGKIVLTI